MHAPIDISMIFRSPGAGCFSLERVGKDIKTGLQGACNVKMEFAPELSKGLLKRLQIVQWAARLNANVYHVTGDIHFVVLGLPGRRTVLTIADCGTLKRLRGLRRLVFLWFWFIIPMRRAGIVTTISNFTADEIRRLGLARGVDLRVVHIPIGDEFIYVPKDFNRSHPKILHVGTAPNKNLVRVIDALKGVSCELNIVGNLDASKIRRLENNGISYTAVSNISDQRLVQIYRECDMVVFASTYEGFGLPIVEAQATGRPIITSTAASMPEVAGNGACYVYPYDPNSIRQGILRVMHEREYRDQLISEGLKNVERFRIPVIAKQYQAVYREIWERAQGLAANK